MTRYKSEQDRKLLGLILAGRADPTPEGDTQREEALSLFRSAAMDRESLREARRAWNVCLKVPEPDKRLAKLRLEVSEAYRHAHGKFKEALSEPYRIVQSNQGAAYTLSQFEKWLGECEEPDEPGEYNFPYGKYPFEDDGDREDFEDLVNRIRSYLRRGGHWDSLARAVGAS